MRYGTIPVVRETGGLKDTVQPYWEGTGTGFTFTNYNADDMLYVLREAESLYQDKVSWKKLMKNAMNKDFELEPSGERIHRPIRKNFRKRISRKSVMNLEGECMDKEQLKILINGKLIRHFGKEFSNATRSQIYHATALVVRDFMMDNWVKTQEKIEKQDSKQVCYLSIEFLLGRSLRNNVFNLGMMDDFNKALGDMGTSLDELYYEEEQDAALGNGGLGRLAACYMDALASLDYPATGYSILYEYGLFKQKIVDGQQIELPDRWMDSGSSWLVPKPSETVEVHFGGTIEEVWKNEQMQIIHKDYDRVLAIPYDMLISGYQGETVRYVETVAGKESPADQYDIV